MEKDTHANTNQNKARVGILISEKVGFKIRNIIKDKNINLSGRYIILNVYVPNKKTSKCMK